MLDIDGSQGKASVLANDGAETVDVHSIVTDPDYGTLDMDDDGTFTYDPDQGYVGPDSFEYKVEYSTGEKKTATVNITITKGEADDPANDEYSVDQDTTLDVDGTQGKPSVLANDGSVTVEVSDIITEPTHGELDMNDDGTFTYVPDEHYNGQDTFVYEVLYSNTDKKTASVTITINATNDDPAADLETGKVPGDTFDGTITPVNVYNDLVFLAQLQTTANDVPMNLRNGILADDGDNENEREDLANADYATKNSSDTFIEYYAGDDIQLATEDIAYLSVESGEMGDLENDKFFEADTVVIDFHDDQGEAKTIEEEWHVIYFAEEFEELPVVVAELASHTGHHPAHARVRNVTTESFEVWIEEWEPQRNSNHHNHELLSYVAAIPGEYPISDGRILEVGTGEASQAVQGSTGFELVTFATRFVSGPEVFSNTQTWTSDEDSEVSNYNQVWVRQRNIAPTTFEYKVITDTTTNDVYDSIDEAIGYIAVGLPFVNTPPTANDDYSDTDDDENQIFDDYITTPEDTNLDINVLDNDTDTETLMA